MPISLAAKDAMLRSSFAGQLWLGLTTMSGREETDDHYQRQPVTLDADGVTDTLLSVEELRFPPYANASVVRGWVLYGPSGQELGRDMLESPKRMAPGERLMFEPRMIIVRLED